MADPLDFAGLRDEIELATRIPEFELVAKRARQIRRRGRLAVLGSVLGILLIIGPAGVASVLAQPTTGPAGPDVVEVGPDRPEDTAPAPVSSVPPLVTVEAVDGVDLAHAYALVDICYDDTCNLQLVPVRAADGPSVGPAKINLLRTEPTDVLFDITLRAQTDRRMLVSAKTSAGRRIYDQVDVGNTAPSVASAPPPSGLWPVQPDTGGVVSVFDLLTGRMQALPAQPGLSSAVVVPGIAAGRGIWVTGTDPVSGEPAVAVSHDGGRHWSSNDLALPGATEAELASYDGQHGYLLARTPTGFRLAVTSNGGLSWQVTPNALPWPMDVALGVPYGLAVRPDGAVLAWVGTTPTISYLQSGDHGASFHALDNGPGGELYPLPDGYVTVGPTPKLSKDAATWTAAKLPYLLR